MMDMDEEIRKAISPKWHQAYALGDAAQRAGKPKECDLGEGFQTPGGSILKVYKSAWEQGYDGWKVPEIFTQMEKVLDTMPTHRYDPLEDE
jgi:hypothetical protein